MIVKSYPGIELYGNQKFRDKNCPRESIEQITFVNNIKLKYPESYGKIICHIENEGQVSNGQFSSIIRRKAMGSLNKGASDIIIPGHPAFVCEIKRADRTLSDITLEQLAFLYAAKEAGAFVCIALGHDAAIEAFNHWIELCIHVESVLNFKKQNKC